MLNREIKIYSLQRDILNTRPSTLSEATNQSYLIGRPQPYLLDALTHTVRSKIINLRVHAIPIKELNHRWGWGPSEHPLLCRLCLRYSETWAHLLCICPYLIAERIKLLKPIFLKRGSTSIREAEVLCFRGTLETHELARFAKYVFAMEKALHNTQSGNRVDLLTYN